jgi:tRNA threonylcarbamoyladenosine biosynthesis protein TsaB
MIFLAVDSSGRDGSLALARGAGDSLEILELVTLNGGNFSAQLLPQMADLLRRRSLTFRDIGGLAGSVGPGSFTGLRVGLAAIKGLAEALSKPVVVVSRLEAVATAYPSREILAALDAGRSQAFVGEYGLRDNGNADSKEYLLSWEELAAQAGGRVVITPDENVAAALRALGTSVSVVPNPRADAIAIIGWKKLQAGDHSDVATFEANYIRRTDAEILVHGK